MISYIFKNKTKNILMIIFTCLHILNTNIPYELYFCIIHGSVISIDTLLSFLAYILILVYMFTLKMKYRFKEWLVPTAFAILCGLVIYDIIFDIIDSLTQYGNLDSTKILSIAINAVSATLLALCFCGSIKNFKNAIFLKIGSLATMIYTVVMTITEFILVGGTEYFANIPTEYLASVYISFGKAMIKIVMILLFYFGLFNLTLNKKSEYIDITPFVDARKAKKLAKRNARLEAKQQEEACLNEPTPEIPDGSWRCMACGKILPDSIDRCECGYKK